MNNAKIKDLIEEVKTETEKTIKLVDEYTLNVYDILCQHYGKYLKDLKSGSIKNPNLSYEQLAGVIGKLEAVCGDDKEYGSDILASHLTRIFLLKVNDEAIENANLDSIMDQKGYSEEMQDKVKDIREKWKNLLR